jgi:hypothetical protein
MLGDPSFDHSFRRDAATDAIAELPSGSEWRDAVEAVTLSVDDRDWSVAGGSRLCEDLATSLASAAVQTLMTFSAFGVFTAVS